MHVISKNEKAVIILDQLDALRWTQANSSEAVTVCMQLIKQIEYLNYERNFKIIIVFVCRTYDLQNDNNIKMLFKSDSDLKQENNNWKRIEVQNFDEILVEEIVGEKYKELSKKMKQLLQIPSNLYIWQHLDKNQIYDDCITTSHLIEKWYKQICRECINVGVSENVVKETQKQLVKQLDKIGRLYMPRYILEVEESGLDYLISAEIIVGDGNRVGFVHQSILDYFISKRMMQQYFDDKRIEEIVGEKRKQTPSRRYQIQMFLQNLLEYDSAIFLEAGKKLLLSNEIRYYVKSIFYEILGLIHKWDENINEFILESCKDEKSVNYLLNNVISGNQMYISLLRESGILEKWISDNEKKSRVYFLFRSISPNFSFQDIEFIKKHSFKNSEDDKQLQSCFLHNIMQESDEMFELRMLFYQYYPEWTQELYIDMKSMMKNCEKRTIKIIAFLLENKINTKGRNVYRYEEDLMDGVHSFLVKNGKYVIEELLKFVPKENLGEIKYGDWSDRYFSKCSLERVVVRLIKEANKAVINQNPDLFWIYYESYMGEDYVIYNEIILDGLKYLPPSYSNRVISYLSNDLDRKIFDYTSGVNEQLKPVIEVIKKHADLCDDVYLRIFESTIVNYVSPKVVEWYKDRIEMNRSKKYEPVYWAFWGDLQYQLLKNVPYKRLSYESKKLLEVLERKFDGKSFRYNNGNGHSGGISSPVSGKKIGKKQWLQIITNKKLTHRKHSHWREVEGGFIESSLEMYASDFSSEVGMFPEEIIQLVLRNKKRIVPFYIDSVYSGAAFSEKFHEIAKQTWEDLFKEFPCDLKSYRASYFCTIIEKEKDCMWSSDILKQLKDIAIYYSGESEENDFKGIESFDSEKLYSKASNCVRGSAARAIGHLLEDNKELFQMFEKTIDMLIVDENPAVKMASLYALWPVYNINREWAEVRILHLYESDIRITLFRGSKDMFFFLYPKYRERIILLIRNCFESKDKKLIQLGGCSICEFLIQYGEFSEIIENIEMLNEEQIKAILHMAVIYLKYEEQRDIAKEIILKYINTKNDIEYNLESIFYHKLVDVERDMDFLLQIMNSRVNKRIVFSFVHFLEKNSCSFKEYAEIIITLCENVLGMNSEEIVKYWGIEDDISKLIIYLYDECANSEKTSDKEISEKCLELWDIMFEKQIGRVRELSQKLMER